MSLESQQLPSEGINIINSPIAYAKARVSQSINKSHIMHKRSGSMPGRNDLFAINPLSKPAQSMPLKENPINYAFRRNLTQKLHKQSGIINLISSKGCFTYRIFHPNDDETLLISIKAAYRQVFGNIGLMESEKLIDTERRLRNGDITIRDFIRTLAKSDIYKKYYLENLSQSKSIEFNYKHILGRNYIEKSELTYHICLLHNYGYECHIDNLIDSEEYEEVFGSDIVPYNRSLDSGRGIPTSNFYNMHKSKIGFASSHSSSNNVKY